MVHCWQNDHDSLYMSSLCSTVIIRHTLLFYKYWPNKLHYIMP